MSSGEGNWTRVGERVRGGRGAGGRGGRGTGGRGRAGRGRGGRGGSRPNSAQQQEQQIPVQETVKAAPVVAAPTYASIASGSKPKKAAPSAAPVSTSAASTTTTSVQQTTPTLKKEFQTIDIGVNLTLGHFHGTNQYGQQVHASDFETMLQRSLDIGVEKMIVTGLDFYESKKAYDLCLKYKTAGKKLPELYCTVGVHPKRCGHFLKHGEKEYTERVLKLAKEGIEQGIVVAFGEFGIDYERLNACKKETQLQYFEHQFSMLDKLPKKLPLFLHERACMTDFLAILEKNVRRFSKFCVHCFTGSQKDLEALLNFETRMNQELKGQHKIELFIGLTGASFKTKEQIEMVKAVPVEKLLIETDAPYCQIVPRYEGYKYLTTTKDLFTGLIKPESQFQHGYMIANRNEPCTIVQVLEAIANVKQTDMKKLSETVYQNTTRCFFPKE